MSSHTSIAPEHIARDVGTQRAPVVIDLRSDAEFADEPFLIPASIRRDPKAFDAWGQALAPALTGKRVVTVCRDGGAASQGIAARLRQSGIAASFLDAGFKAWRASGHLLTRAARMPSPTASGATLWVTRERPKIDRIACPWLVRRFVDPDAEFLFVEPAQVVSVADRFNATPFDIEGVFWSHRAETCTFDTMLTEFGLKSEALDHLASIVRGADTARLDLSPEAPGFLAFSLGLSRLFDDDLAQLEAGLTFYDAVYLWCRDARGETHNWPAAAQRTRGGKAAAPA